MNDLVFVMCNLKLNDNQVKKQADDFGVKDYLSSDDDWITEGEKHSNFDLLGAIDSATRRQNGNEDESDEEEIHNDAKMKSHELKMIWRFKLLILVLVLVVPLMFIILMLCTSSDTNNPLDANDIDGCLRNNKEDEGNEADFSLHDTPADCLF
jgi:hypothetical protein